MQLRNKTHIFLSKLWHTHTHIGIISPLHGNPRKRKNISSESCCKSHMLVRKSEGNRSRVVWAFHPLFEGLLAARASSEGRFDLSLWNLQGQDSENLTQLLGKCLSVKSLPLQTSLLYTAQPLLGNSAVWCHRGPSPAEAGRKEEKLLKAVIKKTFPTFVQNGKSYQSDRGERSH